MPKNRTVALPHETILRTSGKAALHLRRAPVDMQISRSLRPRWAAFGPNDQGHGPRLSDEICRDDEEPLPATSRAAR